MASDRLHASQQRNRLRGQWHQVVNLHFNFASRYAPLGRIQVNLGPFRCAQFSRSDKHERGQLERCHSAGVAGVVEYRPHQFAGLFWLGDRSKV